MASPARMAGPDIAVPHASPETISRNVAEGMHERSTAGESVRPAATARPTESEIATVAYLLWVVNGCPGGTDQEHWFRAEAMLNAALAAQREGPSRRASIPHENALPEDEILAEFRVEGHWEVWESEWDGARWVCDASPRGR